MNAIDWLIREHREHKDLLDKVESSRKFYPQLKKEIVHHVNNEEAILYPRLLNIPEFKNEVTYAWKDHNRIMELLKLLDDEKDDGIWMDLFQELKTLHLQHIEEEEVVLFPRVMELTSEDYLNDVREQMIFQRLMESAENILYPEIPGCHEL